MQIRPLSVSTIAGAEAPSASTPAAVVATESGQPGTVDQISVTAPSPADRCGPVPVAGEVAASLVPGPVGAALGEALPELLHPVPRSFYDKTLVKQALTQGTHLVYGAELASANPATAVTMAEAGGLSVLHFPGANATAPEVQGLSMAVRPGPQVVLGHFNSATDPNLKQKMDAGMHGAVLDAAEDPSEVRAFLDRLFFSPLGNRPGGPAYASGFLSRFTEMVEQANDVVLGGVSIQTTRGVERIEEIVAAVDSGLNLVMVDSSAIARSLKTVEGSPEHRAALQRVESTALQAGVALGAYATTRGEAEELSRRGYRHVVLGSDVGAVDEAFGRYQTIPREPERTPSSRPGEWNPINRWLREGKVAEVGFLMTPDLQMARALAARSDALWIDAEHGPYAPEQVKALLSALPPDFPVLVRVQKGDHPDIASYLEAGARGIIAPNVGSADEAADFVSRVKSQNAEATAVVMIENQAGLANAEAIARTPGVDLVHLGPYDLALSLRTAMGSEEHREAVTRIEQAVTSAGLPLGGASPSRTRTAELADRGYRFLTTVSDQEAVLGTFRSLFAEPARQVRVIRAGTEDPLARYVGPTVLQEGAAPWQTRADGTQVRAFQLGDDLTVQAVRKDAARIGGVFEHTHPETQITIIEKGHSRMEILGQTFELGPGDVAVIPGGVSHRFTDLSSEIQVVDLLVPRRQGDLPTAR